MKKILLAGAMALAAGAFVQTKADVKVNMPTGTAIDTFTVTYVPLTEMLQATRQTDLNIRSVKIPVVNGSAIITLDAVGPARYNIELTPEEGADFYASPEDNLVMNISSVSPLGYTVTGTPLMDGLTEIDKQIKPIEAEFSSLIQTPGVSEEEVMKLLTLYNDTLKEYINDHPDSPASIYALLNLEGEDFLTAYDNLAEEAKSSLLYPFALKQEAAVRAKVEKEQMQRNLANGTKEAPDFTFLNADGKKVSLSDFRGKWVVIDFWGSWCPWCIKGFPALKEAYSKYKGKIEVLGVACNDTREAWLAALKKYDLPWVNVFNPEQGGGKLAQDYGIQGYPTKAIVNPEGKLVNITTGEDPSFYTTLANFLK